jgi:uncharacterized iron-regulated membrane protein
MNYSTGLLRAARTWHRKVAAALFVFFLIISFTGILLGWKNMFSSDIYHAASKQKVAHSTKDWLPLDSLKQLAILSLRQKLPAAGDTGVERMDARMDKGTIRFSFRDQYNVQLNARTGELQSIDKKYPEWFLHLHDGEIVNDLFNIKNGAPEKIYTSIIGLALFFLTVSGFWMWYKPKQIKNLRRYARPTNADLKNLL